MSQRLRSFDLVVATVGRTDELARLLDSLAAQNVERLRVIIVDQNHDARLDAVVAGRPFPIERIRRPLGLSRARNAGLTLVTADLVAFPDDDCVYPPGLLVRVAERLDADPELAGLTGRSEDARGRSAPSWRHDHVILTDDNLWNRAISFTIFLRRDVVEAVGPFDEELGLGSGRPWGSGEETDYVIRAVRTGARIEYDPSLVVEHNIRVDDARIGVRDGASVGYLLRKHRYPLRVTSRMLIRPIAGAVLSLLRGNLARSRYQLATLRGRVQGYLGASRSKISE